MKLFLKKMLAFVITTCILACLFDFIFTYFLKKSHEYPAEFEVWNDIYNKSATCDIAVYGSSRAWVQISPKILSDSLHNSVYNFGMDGHNFWLQYLRHKELIKYNNKPKIIILSVDINTLEKRDNLFNPEQFLPYMLYNNNIIDFTSSYVGFRKVDYYFPLIRYSGRNKALNLMLKTLTTKGELPRYRNKGYKGMDRKWNSDFEIAKKNLGYYEAKLDSGSIKLFKSFINECSESGIKLVFVTTPAYIEGQKFLSKCAFIFEFFKEEAKKNKIPYLDYSDDPICIDQSLFYNSAHLNARGSAIFSKKLAHDLKNLHLFD